MEPGYGYADCLPAAVHVLVLERVPECAPLSGIATPAATQARTDDVHGSFFRICWNRPVRAERATLAQEDGKNTRVEHDLSASPAGWRGKSRERWQGSSSEHGRKYFSTLQISVAILRNACAGRIQTRVGRHLTGEWKRHDGFVRSGTASRGSRSYCVPPTVICDLLRKRVRGACYKTGMQNDILTSLTRLSDAELMTRLKSLVARERDATAQLVAHLAELDTRDAFLREGYGSLHVYCRDALGLSDGEPTTVSRSPGRPAGFPSSSRCSRQGRST
jgi:hypothetical protein